MSTTHELRLVSWNVNGLRAVMKKDPSFVDVVEQLDADVFAVQETKLQEGQIELDLPGYHQTWSYAERMGYSGTAVFSREEPLRVLRADAVLEVAHNARRRRRSWPLPQPRVASARSNSTATGL